MVFFDEQKLFNFLIDILSIKQVEKMAQIRII